MSLEIEIKNLTAAIEALTALLTKAPIQLDFFTNNSSVVVPTNVKDPLLLKTEIETFTVKEEKPLTEAERIQAKLAKTQKSKPKAVTKVEPVIETNVESKSETDVLDLNTIRHEVVMLIRDNYEKKELIKPLFEKFNATNVDNLQPDQYAAFYEEFKKL